MVLYSVQKPAIFRTIERYILKREVTINFDEFSSVINSVIYFHFLSLNTYDIVYEFMYFLVRMVFKVATQRIKRNLV